MRPAPLAALALSAALLAGCAPGKADIEKSIREEMKTSLNVEITSVDLTKQSDGSYSGTAKAANGDVYDVTTQPPKGTRVEWKALPSQPVVERLVKEMMEKQLPVKVDSLTLTKQGGNTYSGTAVLASGEKFAVTANWEGTNLRAEWKPVL